MSRIIFSIVVIGALGIAQPQYKKAHRAALRKVVDGQAGAVVTQMRARMAVDPSDPEDWFLLAIALVKRGDLDEAVAAVARAEALGLPAGRLAAASVDWLEPIAGREPLSKLRARMKHSALMGPMVGHVGPDEAHARRTADVGARAEHARPSRWRRRQLAHPRRLRWRRQGWRAPASLGCQAPADESALLT